MKRFVVQQTGSVQVEATRSFVVEVPDHFTDEMIAGTIQDIELRSDDGMEWKDDDDREWIGFDVDVVETDIYETDDGETAGASLIRFGQDIEASGIGR